MLGCVENRPIYATTHWAPAMKQQDQAVAWVEEMGGLIFRGDDLDDDGKQILCFGIGQIEIPSHRVAAGFSVHSPVIRVDISDKHSRITDLTPLASLITLRTLNLSVRASLQIA